MSDLKKIKEQFFLKLEKKLNLFEINQIKSDLFGKNGLISSQFKKIGTIPETERKKFATELNIVKDELQNFINSKIDLIENSEIKADPVFQELLKWMPEYHGVFDIDNLKEKLDELENLDESA